MSEIVQSCLAPYPERPDAHLNWADRLYAALETPAALALQHVGRRRAQRPARDPARDPALPTHQWARFDAAELKVELVGLGERLRAEGLDRELAATALGAVAILAERVLGEPVLPAETEAAHAVLMRKIAETGALPGSRAVALAAAVAALAGIRVHVLYASAWRAAADAARFAPLFSALGHPATAVESSMDRSQRRAAYQHAVVYAFCRDVAFDYLRDRVALHGRPGPIQLRIEALVDPARRLSELMLPGLQFAMFVDADVILVEDASVPVAISADSDLTQEQHLLHEVHTLADQLAPAVHYQTTPGGLAQFTPTGRARLAKLAESARGVWAAPARREELVQLALSLRPLAAGHDYLVAHDRVEIRDGVLEAAGATPDKRRLMVSLLEAREHLTPLQARETVGRLSLQRFYRRYLWSGGCAESLAGVRTELWRVFRLGGWRIRGDAARARAALLQLPARVFVDEASQLDALMARIAEATPLGRAVIVAFRRVESAHAAAARLATLGVAHELVAGVDDARAATLFANAARPGQVTLMLFDAAHGTRLSMPATPHPGLDLLVAELPPSSRIERRLVERVGLPSVARSAQTFAALDDPLLRAYLPAALVGWLGAGRGKAHDLPRRLALRYVQWAWARDAARHRRQLLKREDFLGDALAFAGQQG